MTLELQQSTTTEYYEYNHGTGEHYLVRETVDPDKPRCSWKCFCHYLIDVLCLCLAAGFLVFAFWFAFYELNNADSG